MAKFTIEIDIYSDLICAWCYIGKKTLDKAMDAYIAHHPDVEFKLTWKPYMLWPNADVSAYEKGAVIQSIFGHNAPSVRRRVNQLGEQYGIKFKWEGKMGNTRDAHKLVLLAMERDAAAAATGSSSSSASSFSPFAFTQTNPSGTQPSNDQTATTTTTLIHGTPNCHYNNSSNNSTNNSNRISNIAHYNATLQKMTITRLFALTFQQGADISSRAVLAAAAVDLGLCATEAEALAYLSRGEGEGREGGGEEEGKWAPGKVVDESSARARQIGVRAVPSYVVQSRWQVGGMQREDVWMGVFERVRRGLGGD
ncbi:hypothetical protein C7999DRAFT_27191 [Corynascus novoguineensis]|uniref:DSBA-like thioredoxin domain-containing protein n=1 Tax=Corynascus novoguineensis TaxID=1126955 RepID=A0AAN7HVM2_9PEZI|nr:hypothetical protein C7999DRAFT_27191 [Corynascus novoguineensis]